MKIAIIGYGRMGQIIESVLLEKGHTVTVRIDVNNAEDFESTAFISSDVAIEFSSPKSAANNIVKSLSKKVPVVSGSTGWLDQMDEVLAQCQSSESAFFYASNFSLGVNILFEMNENLARRMNDYEQYTPSIKEWHHTKKVDAPSGTAVTLADAIVERNNRFEKWICNMDSTKNNELSISAYREGEIFGIHQVKYESEVDFIEITHHAKSRKGFAIGAVMAAEFLYNKQGVYSMKDLLGIK